MLSEHEYTILQKLVKISQMSDNAKIHVDGELRRITKFMTKKGLRNEIKL